MPRWVASLDPIEEKFSMDRMHGVALPVPGSQRAQRQAFPLA
jgi:hypothetical protein